MAATVTSPPELSVTEPPFPVVPFPASWLVQFGGLNTMATRPSPIPDGAQVSVEPGQAATDPQE